MLKNEHDNKRNILRFERNQLLTFEENINQEIKVNKKIL